MEAIESGIHFKFGREWTVKEYDRHRFFQGLAGAGLKGVDFVALKRDQLLLIEVKNYRVRSEFTTTNPVFTILEDPTRFADSMAQKATDSLRGIRAAAGYYLRRRLTRWLSPLVLSLPPQRHDWFFWTWAAHLSMRAQVHYCLWMEVEEDYRPQAAHWVSLIQERLPEGVDHFDWLHTDSGRQIDGISVTSV